MRTKKGDWVRLCLNGKADIPLLSHGKYCVTRVRENGRIDVRSEFRTVTATNVSSWVLCADMKEHA